MIRMLSDNLWGTHMGEHLAGNIVLRTFFLIFLAELGDKTQLMSMALAAQYRKPIWVFIGAATALAVVTAIGVIFGEALTKLIPARRIHQLAGIVFIIFGVIMLFGKEG